MIGVGEVTQLWEIAVVYEIISQGDFLRPTIRVLDDVYCNIRLARDLNLFCVQS